MADAKVDINSWLEDELYQRYLHDRRAVDDSWKEVFENGAPAQPKAPEAVKATAAPVAQPTASVTRTPAPAVKLNPDEQLVPLRGIAAKIAENMDLSLALPIATSQRTIPVKIVDENRLIINQRRVQVGLAKVSYTHLIGWAIVKALETNANINSAFVEHDGELCRVVRPHVNLGIAVDVEAKDGTRNLVVPNIKKADTMDFRQYVLAFDDLIARARKGRLMPDDFSGTTISLTNPGTVGTMGSIPRLMPGQGAIIAVGAIDYPAEFQGVAPEMRAALGISKVMTMTCTYDHRIIQGAESGMFLGQVQDLLEGKSQFYEQVFADLKMPHRPVSWAPDRGATLAGGGLMSRHEEHAKEAAVVQLINAYRVRGHVIADIDPLGSEPGYHPDLDPATYGLSIWDLDREFYTQSLSEALGHDRPVATLREILERLRQTYCGKIGIVYMHIANPEEKRWLQHRMEPEANHWPLDREHRIRILKKLIEGEEFEHFLHARFVGQKRFAVEGGESSVVILEELIDRAANQGVHEVVMGMAHRGRLNVLANIVGKPLTQIFSEFEGNIDPASTQGSGDVKYHLGASATRMSTQGREVVVSLAPNPSHLEAVDPVVEGIVRPKQDRLGDVKRERVIPLLVHGDAAFAGQGVVAETLQLSQLPGYRTGGTLHVVINNQIGFTTLPGEARSTTYSTDVARMVQAPIFHVNGDDPEAAVRAAQIAYDFRQQFKKDVVIDMCCYRRHGHNEGDDPSYTQPILYRKIKEHPSVVVLYAERLMREGVLTKDEVAEMRKRAAKGFSDAFESAQRRADRFQTQELTAVPPQEWGGFCPRTAISKDLLASVLDGITRFPSDFRLHPKLVSFVEKRREVIRSGGMVDWALGEALAFGSLAVEGTPVRLSGQDSGRGTFSQRHLIFYDYETAKRYIPLRYIDESQARFQVYDSNLSEYAVVGFEFGYSVGDPLTLVLWEAQFGDFVNGSQIMLDQFICCSEQKWDQPTGLVLLLPHGFEGQGPEHSSARIERFLQLCAQNNMQVVNCTTAAQYFHVLRRQMYGGADRRGMRKPLVIFTPKSLLRHPQVSSPIEQFVSGSFREVMGETGAIEPQRVTRLVLCSGKVYYDLLAGRTEKGLDHVALIRLEQLYPFPSGELNDVLLRYPMTADVVWAQEEPKNMGPWRFVKESVQPLLDATGRELKYVGRAESASPATGSYKRHQQEQSGIVEESLSGDLDIRRSRVRLLASRKK